MAPWTAACQVPLVYGILEYWSGLPFPSPINYINNLNGQITKKIHKLLKLIQERENVNKPIISRDWNIFFKSHKEKPRPRWLHWWSLPSIKRENNTNSHTNSFGIQRRREYFPTHSERTILLIWKPDKDIRKILQTNFSDEYIRKSHQQNISKPNSATSAKDFTSWSSGNYAWNATLI